MTSLEWWELASYVVTVIGLPFAVLLFFHDTSRERQNEEEEIYLALSDEYAKFCNVLLTNADLKLMTGTISSIGYTDEQIERQKIIFEMLISLFERAYILVYEDDMDAQASRLWATWNDYIEFWLKKPDFKTMLPELLSGEDPGFSKYMLAKAA